MMSTAKLLVGTFLLVSLANGSHIIQKRDLELPEDDDVEEISRLRDLNDRVLQKRSEQHERAFTSKEQEEPSSVRKSKHATNSRRSHLASRTSVKKHDSQHQKHYEKRTKAAKKSKSRRTYKKYTIPAAYAAWKQQLQPIYFAPRMQAVSPAQARSAMNAQEYYKYQQRRVALSNAARLAAWQAYQRSKGVNAKVVGATYNPALQAPSKNQYGSVGGKFPPGGIGRLPQTQQSFSQGKNKQVLTKGSPVSKVLAPLSQAGVKKLPLKSKAHQRESDEDAPAEDNGEEEKPGKESKSNYKLKKSKARGVNAAQRARIDDDDNTEDSDHEEESDEKTKNEDSSSQDNGDEDNADTADDEDTSSGDQSDDDEAHENADDAVNTDDQDQGDENSDSADTGSEDNDAENEDETSGKSRSRIEQNQDTEDNDQKNEDSESQEDGTRDEENAEGEIIAAPDEAPQLQQEIDGPVDPANSPARDTGDENTPPAPEETYTSRSSIDDNAVGLK